MHEHGVATEFAQIAPQVSGIEPVYERLLEAGGSAHRPPNPLGNIIELLEFVEENIPFDLNRTVGVEGGGTKAD